MRGSFNPFATWANAMQIGLIAAESQAVIAMRLMGMAGFWSIPKSEDSRMISEKVWAMTKSATNVGMAAARGSSPEVITAAGLKPYRSKTRANARRLGKRGPKKG